MKKKTQSSFLPIREMREKSVKQKKFILIIGAGNLFLTMRLIFIIIFELSSTLYGNRMTLPPPFFHTHTHKSIELYRNMKPQSDQKLIFFQEIGRLFIQQT